MAKPEDQHKDGDEAATSFPNTAYGAATYGSLKRPTTFPSPLDKFAHRNPSLGMGNHSYWSFVDQSKDKLHRGHVDGYGGRTGYRAASSVASDSSFSHEEPVQKSPRINTFESPAYQFSTASFSSAPSSPSKFSFTFNDKASDQPIHSKPSIFSGYLNLVQQNLRRQNLEPSTNTRPVSIASTPTISRIELPPSPLHTTPINVNGIYQTTPTASDTTTMPRTKKNQPDQEHALPARSSTRIAIKRSAQDAGVPSAPDSSSPGLEPNTKKVKSSSGGQSQSDTGAAEVAVRPAKIHASFYEEENPALKHGLLSKGVNSYFASTKAERKLPPYQRLDSHYGDWEDDVQELRPDLAKATDDPKGDDAKLVASIKLLERTYPLSGARNVDAEGYGEREDDYGFDARKQGLLPKKKVNYHGHHHRSKVGKKLFAAAKLPKLLGLKEQAAIIAAAAAETATIVPANPRIIKLTIPMPVANGETQDESEGEDTGTASGSRRGGHAASSRPSRGSTATADTGSSRTTGHSKKGRGSRDRAELHADEEEVALHIKRKAGHSLRAQIRRVRYLDEEETDEDEMVDAEITDSSEQADAKEVANVSKEKDSKEIPSSTAKAVFSVEANNIDKALEGDTDGYDSAAKAGTRECYPRLEDTDDLENDGPDLKGMRNEVADNAHIVGRRNPPVYMSAVRGQANMSGFDAHAHYRTKRVTGRQSPVPAAVQADIASHGSSGGQRINNPSGTFHPNPSKGDLGPSVATHNVTSSRHSDVHPSATTSQHHHSRRSHPIPRTLQPRAPPRRDPNETPAVFAGMWDAVAPPETSIPHGQQHGQRAAKDTDSIMTTVHAPPKLRNGWTIGSAPPPPPAETATTGTSGRQVRTRPLIAPRPPPPPAPAHSPDPVPHVPSTHARHQPSASVSSTTPANSRGHAVVPLDHLPQSPAAHQTPSFFAGMWPISDALRQANPNSLLSRPSSPPPLHPKWNERQVRRWIQRVKDGLGGGHPLSEEILDVIDAVDAVNDILEREGLDPRGRELWINCSESLKSLTAHLKGLKSSREEKK